MYRSLKILIVLSVLVSLAIAEEEKYSDIFDHVDVDMVLANDRLRNSHYNCLMDTAPCLTADAQFLKATFPEAVVTKCRKCTDRQIYIFNRIVEYYTQNEPENWERIVRKSVEDMRKKVLT